MNRKDIEKAANEFADREYEYNDIDRDALYKGFYWGAQWCINSVWHDASEKPTKFCDLLLIKLNNGEFELGYEIPAKAKRWAYVRDLLPEENEK